MMDILSHNHWKRPICFAVSVGNENLFGLQQYLYKEGLTFHLMPLKPDPAEKDPLSKTNSMVMYDNMMHKFKWGNYKTAKYLDHESTGMFYPQMVQAFADLAVGLMKDGHNDLAKNAIHKYEEVMPDISPNMMAENGKVSIADTSYKLHDVLLGNKLVASVDDYVTDQLDYNFYLLQNDTGEVNTDDVHNGLYFLNSMAGITQENHETALNTKLVAQLNDYETKFSALLRR